TLLAHLLDLVDLTALVDLRLRLERERRDLERRERERRARRDVPRRDRERDGDGDSLPPRDFLAPRRDRDRLPLLDFPAAGNWHTLTPGISM
ncbi:hypothetical protein ANCDUO_21753, partial [Ancylostoma duodenale]